VTQRCLVGWRQLICLLQIYEFSHCRSKPTANMGATEEQTVYAGFCTYARKQGAALANTIPQRRYRYL